ncbi:MAG: hypothetical protein CMM10_15705 [Rhodospirillaceae bacterium]|nr:hypothetical protein [Rhodospirillaceae bacterium]
MLSIRSAAFGRMALVMALTMAALALNACARTDVYARLGDKLFTPDQAEIVDAVDWENVEVFQIDIRQNEFRPAIIHLFLGEPYIMVVENRDDRSHFLYAPDFFKTVAIRKIVTEKEEVSDVNLLGLVLKPGEVKEVHFVPVRDGWYDFEDGFGPGIFFTGLVVTPFSRGNRNGVVGAFVVEE